jgi:sulfate/thiosulfate-binding protein
VQRSVGEVLLAWENEAFLALEELGQGEFEIVVPSLSILAEPPVTLVDHVVDKYATRKVAQAYLEYLYSPTGQRLAAKYYYRPTSAEAADPADLRRFPKVQLVTLDQVFGGWQKAQKRHFADGGVFDQITTQ